MKSTREAFGESLVELSHDNKNIIVMTADLKKATCVEEFGKKYPKQFYQIGIAEANMIGIASGLAEYGFKIFITSFASFLTGRYDIIRCSLAYSKEPVIIVGTHGGLAIGKDGVTQMGLEDLSLMRSLPNMIVLNPATYSETKAMMEYLCENKLTIPCYVRLGRQLVEDCLENYYISNKFKIDKGLMVKNGNDLTLMTTGCILSDVLKVAKRLEEELNYSVRIVNIHTLKPIDEELIIQCSKKTSIFTIEDHSIIGGLGSAVSDVLSSFHPKKVVKIGLNDIFPESGSTIDLYDKYNLNIDKIFERIKHEMDQ